MQLLKMRPGLLVAFEALPPPSFPSANQAGTPNTISWGNVVTSAPVPCRRRPESTDSRGPCSPIAWGPVAINKRHFVGWGMEREEEMQQIIINSLARISNETIFW